MRRRLVIVSTVLLALLAIGLVAGAGGTDPDANKVGFWCDEGIKIEDPGDPFVVPEPPEGYVWTLLVLKGGTTNETIDDPVVGQGYSHSLHANSHIILCQEPVETTTTTVPPTTTTVPPTTTVPEETTTTVPPTTTTVPEEITTTTAVVVTTDPPASTLPVTGSESAGPAGLAFALMASGLLALLFTRKSDTE